MKQLFLGIAVLACFFVPVCRGQSPAVPVTVTNGWLIPIAELPRPAAYREIPSGRYSAGSPRIVDLMYKQDRFWLSVAYEVNIPPEFDLGAGREFRTIFAFDPVQLRAECCTEALEALPPEADRTLQAKVLPENTGRFDLDASALWVCASPNRVHRYDLKSKALSEFAVDLLDGLTPKLTVLNGKVFLRTADRFLELNPASGSVQLLASARRRPAVTPLDEQSHYHRYLMATNAEGRVCLQNVAVGESGERFFVGWVQSAYGSSWEPFRQGSWPGFGRFPVSDQRIAYDAWLDDPRIMELHPTRPAGVPLLAPAGVAPRWSYPLDYPPRQTAVESTAHAFLRGGDLVLVTPPPSADPYRPLRGDASGRSPNSSTEGWVKAAAPKGTVATLWLFHDAWEEPVIRHLLFKQLTNLHSVLQLSSVTGTNFIIHGTPQGMLFVPADYLPARSPTPAAGFWWLPASHLDKWMADDAASARHTARRQVVWLTRHDRNRDGWLDGPELAQLQADPDFRQDDSQGAATALLRDLDKNNDAAVDQEEFQALLHLRGGPDYFAYRWMQLNPMHRRYLVEAYDTNATTRLELKELGVLLADDLPAVQERLARASQQPTVRPFDVNGDGKLDEQERAAANAARQTAEKSIRLGLGRAYDLNNDGELNAAEEAAFQQKSSKLYEVWKKTQPRKPLAPALPTRPPEKK